MVGICILDKTLIINVVFLSNATNVAFDATILIVVGQMRCIRPTL